MFSGVPAHAGVEPGRGASAIDELAAQITALGAIRGIRDGGLAERRASSRAAGAPNVVAEHARAVIDTRVARARRTSSAVEDAIRGAAPDARRAPRSRVTGGFSRPPLVRTPAVARLYERAREVAAELGRTLDGGRHGRRLGRELHGGARRPHPRRAGERWETVRTPSTSTSRAPSCRGAPRCWPV